MKKWEREAAVATGATILGGLVIWGIRAASKNAPTGGTAPRSGPPGSPPTGIPQTKPCPGGQTWDPVAGACVPSVGGAIPPAAAKQWMRQRSALVAGDRARITVDAGALLGFLQGRPLDSWWITEPAFGAASWSRGRAPAPVFYNPGAALPADWPSDDVNASSGYHIEYTVGNTVAPGHFPPLGAWTAWALK